MNNKEVLEFWKKNQIFEKSLKGVTDKSFLGSWKQKIFGHNYYTFYDGPPFANGLPHYGHVLQSVIKDVVPRYQTMKGNIVHRRWGWDCHGLPVEVEIEKELGLKNKKEIEEYGIGKFNQKARESVLKYANIWEDFIPKVGRWVDMKKTYRTMDTSYTESVWNIFEKLYKNGYVKEGLDTRHICPRCETVVANQEVSLGGYRETVDRSVYVLLPLKNDLNTAIIIWTTTAWTLPGNTAAAVNKDISYVKVKKDNKVFIVAESKKDLIDGEVVEKITGADLVGLEYVPPFDYYYDKNDKISWKIYHADYVSDDSGTGIVHLAPAYGADDMKLAEKNKIKIIHHVGKDGYFADVISDFDKIPVKRKGNPKKLDDQIIEKLKINGSLFKSEDITHTYPHCWRCDTPLLNYATIAWIIDVPSYKNILISENQKINWIPENIKDGRFGKWIADTKEWAIGRSRFWGVPLPIWRCKENGRIIIINSIKDMIKHLPESTNKYMFVRHGESVSNEKGIYCNESCGGLTKKGQKQVSECVNKYKKELTQNEDIILVSSPIKRAQQTGEIFQKGLNIKKENFKTDDRLVEMYRSEEVQKDLEAHMQKHTDVFQKDLASGYKYRKTKDSESFQDVGRRMLLALDEYSKKYKNKVIIFISHGSPVQTIKNITENSNEICLYESVFDGLKNKSKRVKNAGPVWLEYKGLPINESGDIDLHRPYIDKMILTDASHSKYENVKEVFDCWFESGSMPYASNNYPFNNKKLFNPEKNIGFPADFVSEGLDQTRGWFYSLHAISSGAFAKKAYKNIICTGIIQAKDGKKMSKKLKNYTDPGELIEKTGADALRYYLISSSITRGENLSFSDDVVREIERKIFTRLRNCFTFYDTYKDLPHSNRLDKQNILDNWIINKVNQTHSEMTKYFDQYELDRAVKPLGELIEDISTWYLRRSRNRIKSKSKMGDNSRAVMRFVLIETLKLMAPIGPFTAESLYQTIRFKNEPESVHLCFWRKQKKHLNNILSDMKLTRDIVSDALEIRQKENIKVRQTLLKLSIKDTKNLNKKHLKIIAEEINVKETKEDKTIKDSLLLDTKLTKELIEDGQIRELIRSIQNQRKKTGCLTTDVVDVSISETSEMIDLIRKNEKYIKDSALISKLNLKKEDSLCIEIVR